MQSWTVPVTIGTGDTLRKVEVRGELQWVPPVAWWPPVLGVAGAFTVVAVAAMLLSEPRGDRWVGLARPLAVLVWVVAAANAVRVVDDVASVPATTVERVVLLTAAAIGLAVIVALTVWAWRGTPGGFMALGAAGLLMMLLFASDSTDQLSASQLATELPAWIRRWTVAASYLIIIPAFLGAGLAASDHAPPPPPTASR